MEKIEYNGKIITFDEREEVLNTKIIPLREFINLVLTKKISPDDGFIRGILIFHKITNIGILKWKTKNDNAKVWMTFSELERLDGYVEIIWEDL